MSNWVQLSDDASARLSDDGALRVRDDSEGLVCLNALETEALRRLLNERADPKELTGDVAHRALGTNEPTS